MQMNNRMLVMVGAVAAGTGIASRADGQAIMLGSETLESVTKDAITAAAIVNTVYWGGGSTAGEIGMIAETQHIAPMARQLNIGVPDSVSCSPSAQQLLIGLDGIVVVAADQSSGVNNPCPDSVSGGKTLTSILQSSGALCDATDGCSPPGSYTFTSWRDVLQMVYGGLNHSAGAPLNAAAGPACTYVFVPPGDETGGDFACPSGQVCYPNNRCGVPGVVGGRNPSRVNCLNPVRQALVDNYGSIFSDAGAGSCRTGSCLKLRRAFRLDDLSGTTDAFVALVGLPAIPKLTRAAITTGAAAARRPLVDRQATANPFCNAGEKPMNKGDADYLDLDPIRRAVAHLFSTNRFGLEEVGQMLPPYGGLNIDANCMLDTDPNTPGVQPAIPQDHSSSTMSGLWPDEGNYAANLSALRTDLGVLPTGLNILPTPYSASTRLCLGLVIPVALPANYQGVEQAYCGDPITGNTVLCDSTLALHACIPSFRPNAVCPDGSPGACLFPTGPDATATQTVNCLSSQLNPFPVPTNMRDRRGFNIHPLTKNCQYLTDNWLNPNFSLGPGLTNAKLQNRVVSAYYRLHTTRTMLAQAPATGGACREMSAHAQVGCLVAANPCSIGYATREVTLTPIPSHNFAFELDGIAPTTVNIQNLVTGGVPLYPMARDLWLNSSVGFASGALTADELALYNFESIPTNIDPIIVSRGFIPVPLPVLRLYNCPAP
jgi:hypothetical protein